MQTTVTGAGPLTPPVIGLGCAEHVRYPGAVLAAGKPLAVTGIPSVVGTAAPFTGTGLPVAVQGVDARGAVVSRRPRTGGVPAVRTTGAALVATTVPFHRSTPGDRPPGGPLG